MDKKIVKEIAEKIKSLKSGEKFTVSNFLKEYNVGVKDEFSYYFDIYPKIKDYVEFIKEYENTYVGLPQNIPLMRK